MAAWVIGELLQFDGFGALEPVQLVQLQHWLVEGKINRDAMKTAIGVLHANGGDPAEVVERLGLAMVVDDALLRQLVDEALTRHPEERGRYLQGNSRMFGFFMGKIMAASQRRASPATVERLLREALGAVAG
jgi:aspartyl-tRNA(Asn)/glutamyl-tRNA(Gln) amidotransferase subunit B